MNTEQFARTSSRYTVGINCLQYTLETGTNLSGQTCYLVREWRIGNDYATGWYKVGSIKSWTFDTEEDARDFIADAPVALSIVTQGAIAHWEYPRNIKNRLPVIWHTIIHAITPSEIESEFELSAGTVRQYLTRHADDMIKRGVARKADGRTWLIHRDEAARIWGK